MVSKPGVSLAISFQWQMKASQKAIIIALVIIVVLAAMLIASCFLGMTMLGSIMGYRVDRFEPVDDKGQPLAQWTETVEGVRFSMEPYTVGIGSSNSVVGLRITNESNREVVLLGGQLLTMGRTIEAKVNDDPRDRLENTVPAGQSKVAGFFWEFGTSADQVLGPKITWIWKVKIGKDEHVLRVPMERRDKL